MTGLTAIVSFVGGLVQNSDARLACRVFGAAPTISLILDDLFEGCSGGQWPGFEPGAGGAVVPELVNGQAYRSHVEFVEGFGLHGFEVGDGGESDGEVGGVVRADLVRLVGLDPVLGGGADLLAGVGDERGVGPAGPGETG